MTSVSLLHYREWHGRLRRPLWSVWPITRVALGVLFRRRLFWALYAATLLLFLMFFFGGLLLNWIETRLSGPIQLGSFQVDAERIMQQVKRLAGYLQGNHYTFARFYFYQGSAVMVMLTLTGAVLVGNDITYGSLPFYLSKPLGRWHYICGKCLAVALIVNLAVTLPAVLLFAQHGMEEMSYFVDPDYFWKTGDGGPGGPELLLGILAFGAIMSVCLSLLVVATATWVRRTVPLVMVWTALLMFVPLLASLLVDGLKYDAEWRLLDLWNDLCLVGCACLGFTETQVPPQPQPSFLQATLVLLGVCFACLIYLNRRTRAVEVVR